MARLRERFRVRSISFRLHLFVAATVVLTVLLAGYLNSRFSVGLIDSEIEQNASRTASRLAENLSESDAPTDPVILQDLLRTAMESEAYIVRIDVYRMSGNELTRFATTSGFDSQPLALDERVAMREVKTLRIPLYEDKERFLKIVVPFTDAGGTRGALTLIASLRLSGIVGETHRRIALLLVPASLVIAIVLLHFLFTRRLSRRFESLLATMNAASQGRLEIRAPIERTIEQEDELGMMARRYNEMMDEIERASRERDRLLEEQRNFNVHLKERVREATVEVTEANEALRQVNEDLLDTQRRLTQAERSAVVGEMAATFAHEIGSPLSAISTHLELMSEESEKSQKSQKPEAPSRSTAFSEDARRRLGLIREQVERITGFVEELLSETRTSMQPRSPVQLNQLLGQLLSFLEQHLERQRVEIETRFSPDLPEIDANPQQLQQVFLNLLNNACDACATKPEGGKVVVETGSGEDDRGSYVTASVSDNGVGISEEKQGRIFEPFFTTKDLKRGTGLGLSIAARIIRQHHGTIELDSAPEKGARFTVRFPVPVVSIRAAIEKELR